MAEGWRDHVRLEWGCILIGRQPEVLRINREAAGKIVHVLFSFPFYCLAEMIWQSLKINELHSFFFLQSFAWKAFYILRKEMEYYHSQYGGIES